jgi:hypothetical protein
MSQINANTDFPKYSYVDELKGPSELGIRRNGSFGSVADAVAGINYYMDAVGFGNSTAFAKERGRAFDGQQPLGVRFFTKTGLTCSNGAPMYEYVSTIPTGEFMGKRVTKELNNMGFPKLQGLAPGILEDAMSATNPIPFLQAANGGYARCKKVKQRVGSNDFPYIRSRKGGENWIQGPIEYDRSGIPHQTRWILDKWITQKEWDCTPKTENAIEGFENQSHGSQIAAIALLGLLGVAVYHFHRTRT